MKKVNEKKNETERETKREKRKKIGKLQSIEDPQYQHHAIYSHTKRYFN